MSRRARSVPTSTCRPLQPGRVFAEAQPLLQRLAFYAQPSVRRATSPMISRGPLAVDVLDGRLVAPGDLVARQAEDRGDTIAVLRARRPPAEHDRRHSLLVHARALGQLPGIDPALGAELLDGLEGVCHDLCLRVAPEGAPPDGQAHPPGGPSQAVFRRSAIRAARPAPPVLVLASSRKDGLGP